MTCVIGLMQNGKIYMGADSLISDGNATCSIPESPSKLLEINGFLFGFSGSARIQNELMDEQNKPLPSDDEITIANKIYRYLNSKQENGTYLLMSKGKSLIWIGSSGWFSYNDYYAIGSGYQFALGAMFITKNISNPEDRIRMALEATNAHCTVVAPPFIIKSIG
jgi:ATP-dependent protease HslVU (ClpYQ) peptidase subunit